MPNLSSLLQLPGLLGGKEQLVFGGGLPRSGTTHLEAVLQAHPSILCLQEFMPLKSAVFADFLGTIAKTMTFERSVWSDSAGRQWRGYGPEEDKVRLHSLAVACLASTTNTNHLIGKSLKDIRALFCKTPGAELNLLNLKPLLDFSYVHCIRDPIACAKSNWDMPWQSGDDPDQWVDQFGRALGESASAFEAIRHSGDLSP